MSTIAKRVARGAALLDEKQPGWWQRIDLGALDIYSCHFCVLGQLRAFDGEELDFDPDYGFDAPEFPGFLSNHSARMQSYADLTAAWCELIESRRAAP